MLKIKLRKWGNSYGFRLPKQLMRLLNISPTQEFKVETNDERIILIKLNSKEGD